MGRKRIVTQLEPEFWRNQRVFLTGSAGFKGSWMTCLLLRLGATVSGYSLAPITNPSAFQLLSLQDRIHQTYADIRDQNELRRALEDFAPTVIIHMAAQPIVSEGYKNPHTTFDVNIMGTVNLLEAARSISEVEQILVISSDKCYLNENNGQAFGLDDPLGGKDPYSASKAGTEIVVSAYRHSFFSSQGEPNLGSARAGNVVGGGDWSLNRLIPDAIRAFSSGQDFVVRNPVATRPWQHVIEPIVGYLMLIQKMANNRNFAKAWNFGPSADGEVSVLDVAKKLVSEWGDNATFTLNPNKQDWEEAEVLALDSYLTNEQLEWSPKLSVDDAIEWIVAWHKLALRSPSSLFDFTNEQIGKYLSL